MIESTVHERRKIKIEKPELEHPSADKPVESLTSLAEFQDPRLQVSENISGVTDPGSFDGSAEAAYKELEALSYSVSHDLRAPLRAIRSNCDLLNKKHTAHLDTEGRTMLQQISASSEQMEKLLDGLLAFSKVIQLDPQRSLVDMRALARTIVDELQKSEGELPSLAISLKPLLPAYGDTTLMRQVWYNLLSNAFKFTQYKRKREIEIDSFKLDDEVVYCVSDNGVGFDMHYVDRLFGAFHRLHAFEEFEGTGVGLAIVQRIIRRHGGRVWAEGKVDKGARFYFSLPTT